MTGLKHFCLDHGQLNHSEDSRHVSVKITQKK